MHLLYKHGHRILNHQNPFKSQNKNFEDLSTTKESVQEEIVNKHNQLRRMVSPPGSDLLKMQWSNDARVNAQRWASQCTYEHSSPDVRTTNIRCGENIFRANYPASWSHVIQTWYDEVNDFKFASDPNPIDASVGHYTQQMVVNMKTDFLTVQK
nr:cysteine-rich secretory protein 1-like [Peromyscus maniculatus bairdii]